jgi:hypothetical protein
MRREVLRTYQTATVTQPGILISKVNSKVMPLSAFPKEEALK